MPEHHMNFQEQSHPELPASAHQVENEQHNMHYHFEKLDPARRHKWSLNKQLALTLFSIGALILLFFLLGGLTNGLISTHLAYASMILLLFFLFFFLLIVAVIIVNVLYYRRH